jgi:hypothetical protein
MVRHAAGILICLLVCSAAPAAGPALAYVPGPQSIHACPRCGALVAEATTLSGNTIGARFWTDGRMIAPRLPDRPWVVKCPVCLDLLWLDEIPPMGSRLQFEEPDRWPEAWWPITPAEEDYHRLLGTEVLPREKLFETRLRAWWAANDAYRFGPPPDGDLPSIWRETENMNALLDLLDPEDKDERILMAELARELGLFATCLRLLEHDFGPREPVMELVRDLARAGRSAVREATDEME